MTTIAFDQWAGPAAVLGGLLWVPFGVFVMLEPWGAASIYREDLGYGLITDILLFRAYILPGGLALLLSAVGLLGIFAFLGPTAGRGRTSGRLLACVALALAVLSLAGLVALFEPMSAVGQTLGSLALGAATFLAGRGARAAGAARDWTLGLMTLSLAGLLLLPLWPLVYAVELVPPAAGAAFIGLFGLGWVALGYAVWSGHSVRPPAAPQ